MDLILWRHAEAEQANGSLPDTKRRLSAQGEKQARLMACWLLERLPKRLRILVSPSERAQMTAHALGLAFETLPRIGIGADAADVMAAISWPNYGGATLVIGHQPTLGRVAALLVSGVEADWKIKKSGIWWLSRHTEKYETSAIVRAVVDPAVVKSRDMSNVSVSHDFDFGALSPASISDRHPSQAPKAAAIAL